MSSLDPSAAVQFGRLVDVPHQLVSHCVGVSREFLLQKTRSLAGQAGSIPEGLSGLVRLCNQLPFLYVLPNVEQRDDRLTIAVSDSGPYRSFVQRIKAVPGVRVINGERATGTTCRVIVIESPAGITEQEHEAYCAQKWQALREVMEEFLLLLSSPRDVSFVEAVAAAERNVGRSAHPELARVCARELGHAFSIPRLIENVCWCALHLPPPAEKRSDLSAAVLALTQLGHVSLPAAYVVLNAFHSGRPLWSGPLEEGRRLFHTAAGRLETELFGCAAALADGRFHDMLELLCYAGNRCCRLEQAGKSELVCYLSAVRDRLLEQYRAQTVTDAAGGGDGFTRGLFRWLRDSKGTSSHQDLDRLIRVASFAPELAPDAPRTRRLSPLLRLEMLRSFFLGGAQDAETEEWIGGRPCVIELLREQVNKCGLLRHATILPEVFETALPRLSAGRDARNTIDVLIQLQHAPWLLFWRSAQTLLAGHSPARQLLADAEGDLPESFADDDQVRLFAVRLSAALAGLPRPALMMAHVLEAFGTSVCQLSPALEAGAAASLLIAPIQRLKGMARESNEAGMLLSAWLYDFAKEVSRRPAESSLQQLYDRVLAEAFDGLKMISISKRGGGPLVRPRLILPEERFDLLKLRAKYDEHHRRLEQQYRLMHELRGEGEQAQHWEAGIRRLIETRYSRLLRSNSRRNGFEMDELFAGALGAIGLAAYNFDLDRAKYGYMETALQLPLAEQERLELLDFLDQRLCLVEQEQERTAVRLAAAASQDERKLLCGWDRKLKIEKRFITSSIAMQHAASRPGSAWEVAEHRAQALAARSEFVLRHLRSMMVQNINWRFSAMDAERKKWQRHERTVSLDHPISHDDSKVFQELVGEQRVHTLLTAGAEVDPRLRSLLWQALQSLPSEAQRMALSIAYGLDPDYPDNLGGQDIAMVLAFHGLVPPVTRQMMSKHLIAGEQHVRRELQRAGDKQWDCFIELLGSKRNPPPAPYVIMIEQDRRPVRIGRYLELRALNTLSPGPCAASLVDHTTRLLEPADLKGSRVEPPPSLRMPAGRSARSYVHELILSLAQGRNRRPDLQHVLLLTCPDGEVVTLRDEVLS